MELQEKEEKRIEVIQESWLEKAHRKKCSIALDLNEMKYILFGKIYINLQQFQVTPENKTQGNL